MQPASSAANAYMAASRTVGDPRTAELQAFQAATAKLRAARADGASFATIAEAVHFNTKLWLAVATDVARDENQLSVELRAQLFNLAEFSRKHGAKVLNGDDDVAPLIDVNTAILKGLRGASETPSAASE